MNGYRKMMQDRGGNLGWCAPYQSEDGSVKFSVNEGKISGLMIDGVNIDGDTDIFDPNYYTATTLEKVARRVNKNYDDCIGWDVFDIIMDVTEPIPNCSDCPFFDTCDAMDNPDTWDEMSESKEYTDD